MSFLRSSRPSSGSNFRPWELKAGLADREAVPQSQTDLTVTAVKRRWTYDSTHWLMSFLSENYTFHRRVKVITFLNTTTNKVFIHALIFGKRLLSMLSNATWISKQLVHRQDCYPPICAKILQYNMWIRNMSISLTKCCHMANIFSVSSYIIGVNICFSVSRFSSHELKQYSCHNGQKSEGAGQLQ